MLGRFFTFARASVGRFLKPRQISTSPNPIRKTRNWNILMPKSILATNQNLEPELSRRVDGRASIPVLPLAISLGAFLAITFVLCVLFDLWFPEFAMNRVWSPLLPGFTWISWPSFLLGLVESTAYGFYVAFIFGPIFNYFASRTAAKS